MDRPEPKFRTSCVDRFLRYVKYDTQSVEGSDSYPSTAKQLELSRLLVEELKELGIEDAALDDHGYVFATIPENTGKETVPVIGFIAHVDTSPEMSGKDVKPIIHENYQGAELVLPDDPSVVLNPSEDKHLPDQVGNDIITASGTTLLGADNKAGVAEIMGAAEYLMAHPEIQHGRIRIGFTPDEEVGEGTKFFDVERFGAAYAYTMDGETLGEIEMETFSADSLYVTFKGFNTHPGYAKGKMVNAIKIAADFIHRLPKDGLSPETTEGYEGYVHPYVMEAGVDSTTVKFLIRDFKTPLLAEHEAFVKKLAEETLADYPGATVEFKVEESYRNMREVLENHHGVVENAKEAIRRSGLEVQMHPIRGGTDGARLSFMGLPTPNIFAGEHNFHSRLEWISIYDMHKAVEVIVNLCALWEEQAES
jgi:tripeptide aminopeptidase